MGIFNIVKEFIIECPTCGTKIGEFQTKDDTYTALFCEEVDFRSVRKFYTSCHNCDSWIEYILIEDWEKRTIHDYKQTVTTKERWEKRFKDANLEEGSERPKKN